MGTTPGPLRELAEPAKEDGMSVLQGDCREVLRGLEPDSVNAIVTDPPYELGFMGKRWDRTGVAYDIGVWREALRVLKPGGHLLAFGGSRTYHRLACAIEDAGFEIRDQIMWLYGSGFPKSRDVSKAIDAEAGVVRDIIGPATRHGGGTNNVYAQDAWTRDNQATMGAQTEPATEAARQWQGWGTALKPAHEPVVLARKPLVGTVAENVLEHGTGALNVDGCMVGTSKDVSAQTGAESGHNPNIGRWPANVIHDGSDEVEAAFAAFGEKTSGRPGIKRGGNNGAAYGAESRAPGTQMSGFNDTGSASRFFYCAKASKADRNDGLDGEPNKHPTVKPTALMRYLCRLITPPGGTVLDPFAGSGSTGRGALLEGFKFIGIEVSEEYAEIARLRIEAAMRPAKRAHEAQGVLL